MNKTISYMLLLVSTFGFILFGCKFMFELLMSGTVLFETAYTAVLNIAAMYVSLNYIFKRWE